MKRIYSCLRPLSVIGAIIVMFAVIGCSNRSSSPEPSNAQTQLQQPGSSSSHVMKDLLVHVVDENGAPIVGGFRWLVEIDTTYDVQPGVVDNNTPSTSIFKDYSPVYSAGDEPTDTAAVQVPDDVRLFVSVLSTDNNYTLSGRPVGIGQTDVTIIVHSLPIPTAQCSIVVFHDNKSLNGAYDQPDEAGLPGFAIQFSDLSGMVMQDAFGNMIGTTYQKDVNGDYIMDTDGNPIVDTPGTGVIYTDANGEARVPFLVPDHYIVTIVPPEGQGWVLTATFEGTQGNDAWVRPGEPRFTADWGFLNWLTVYGYIQKTEIPAASGTTGNITGQVVYVHDAHPPASPGLAPGHPVPYAWVGLNDLNAADECIYAQPTDAQGNFDIAGVPPGTYQLVMFDEAIDAIIDFRNVTIPPTGGTVELGPTPIYAWFGTLEGTVFNDSNENGFRDPGEAGIRDVPINFRATDGTIIQSTITDPNGHYSLKEVFPFMKWTVVEVDSAEYKATGMTTSVDNGGFLPSPDAVNNPQPQVDALGNPIINPNTGDNLSRTQVGDVNTQAMILWAGQTNVIDWGKVARDPNEAGPISGGVSYDTTRAEDDPRYGTAEPWQPGIPRVQVILYQDAFYDGVIDDINGDGHVTLADVDNWPLGWAQGGAIGPEDVDRNGNGTWDAGDALQVTWSYSWDDNFPDAVGPTQYVHGQPIVSGAETLATWDQVRLGDFDGHYQFDSYHPGGMESGSPEVPGLPSGYYIVAVSIPSGFEVTKEEDRNVFFGDSYIPADMLTPDGGPPMPVGDLHLVPPELSLFPGVPGYFAGQMRPLADKKEVFINATKNTAVDFFLFTVVPKAARTWGWVTNDLALEFNPSSPNMGGNMGPAWMPVSFKDFTMTEVNRVYTDEWGRFDAMMPSTYTINPPNPIGVSPNMLGVYPNDPFIPDPDNPGQTMLDPWLNPAFMVEFVGESWDFWPGQNQNIDTIVLPIAAFSQNRVPIDCDFPDGTPIVKEVDSPDGGPYVSVTPELITITAVGNMDVPNPDYNPDNPIPGPASVTRDYGFGTVAGSVNIGGVPLSNVTWSNLQITGQVPIGASTGQLKITRGDNGLSSILGITVFVQDANIPQVIHITPNDSIQAAIDGAQDNALILMEPGIYMQNPIMYKPVKLQGYGAYSTAIEPWLTLLDPILQQNWMNLVGTLVGSGDIVYPPGTPAANPVLGGIVSQALDGIPGITVATSPGRFTASNPARIDGILVLGAEEMGGAILVKGYANNLIISNCKLEANQGTASGGIRLGTPSLLNTAGDGFNGSFNQNIVIRNNHIAENGSLNGGGGGIALYKGSDNCLIAGNWICGNFALNYGGGIQQLGVSDGVVITGNTIVSNQSGDEGGGIALVGELVPAGAPAGTLTEGVGNVTVNANIIHGNLSGDDGGGLRTLLYNGQDVQNNPSNPDAWYQLDVFNNFITNNLAPDAGGGISLDDSAKTFIINNTIADNDSTATGSDNFGGVASENTLPPGFSALLPPEASEAGLIGGLTTSVPVVAGINGGAHSAGLQAAFGSGYEQTYSNPVLEDNIIYHNRSFFWDATYNGGLGGLRPDISGGEAPVYWDLGVSGTPTVEHLYPMNSILTTIDYWFGGVPVGQYDASNLVADPLFADPYFNDMEATSKGTTFGNFVQSTFRPNGLRGDYRITSGSPAINLGAGNYIGTFSDLLNDIFGNPRPSGGGVDSGAYQLP